MWIFCEEFNDLFAPYMILFHQIAKHAHLSQDCYIFITYCQAISMISEVTILLTTLIATMTAFSGIWAFHLYCNDASVVDLYWGPGFAAVAIIALVMSGEPSVHKLILSMATITWATRLGLHMARRHHGSKTEDRRYAKMRERGGASFWWVSLFKIFLLQALLLWLIATPQHMGLIYGNTVETASTRISFILGAVLFTAGLIVETVADRQLIDFKRKPDNADQTLMSGLWRYSRHPNYFGEVVLWWGLGLMGFALSGSLVSFAGPALLTFLILKVSGVTLLEQHLKPAKEGYEEYIEKTSAFFPRSPR